MIKVLLAGGANPNQAKTDKGSTPLIMAAWKGHTAAVRALLAAADIDLHHIDTFGDTALDAAKYAKKKLKEDDEEGRRKLDEVIALLEQKMAATAVPKAEASKGKGMGKGKKGGK